DLACAVGEAFVHDAYAHLSSASSGPLDQFGPPGNDGDVRELQLLGQFFLETEKEVLWLLAFFNDDAKHGDFATQGRVADLPAATDALAMKEEPAEALAQPFADQTDSPLIRRRSIRIRERHKNLTIPGGSACPAPGRHSIVFCSGPLLGFRAEQMENLCPHLR